MRFNKTLLYYEGMPYLQTTITDLNYKPCLHILKVLNNTILKNINIII